MGLRFRQSIQILPGLRLTISPSGLSANVGIPGAGVTLGRDGTHANLGIPGTGLSYRARLGPGETPAASRDVTHGSDARLSPLTPAPIGPRAEETVEFRSAATAGLTSSGIAPLRDLIMEGASRRRTAMAALASLRREGGAAKSTAEAAIAAHRGAAADVAAVEASWFRAFRKGRLARLTVLRDALAQDEIEARARRADLDERTAAAEDEAASEGVEIDFELTAEAERRWESVVHAFRALAGSHYVWDVTSRRTIDRVATRSRASHAIDRQPTRAEVTRLPLIRSLNPCLCWRNVNGDDLFLYPGFMMVGGKEERFGVIGRSEYDIVVGFTAFSEDEVTPHDSDRVGTTWRYVNRDGGPDRRFADNPELPIYRYGRIAFNSATGLNEAFMFSASDAVLEFTKRLEEFEEAVGEKNAIKIA